MKKTILVLATAALALATQAQTMNVQVGNVIYQFPAAQAGEMEYAGASSLTVMNKEFALSDITQIYFDDTKVTDNSVLVSYDGSTATVSVAGNVAQYVTPTVSGAHVSIDQSNTDAVDNDEITYTLSGSTSDGEFALTGSYKCTISLAGLSLTNPSGAAISIGNKKRIQVSAKNGTENTLTDGSGGSQKGCLYSKGQIQLQGKGTLTVYGNTAHAIKSGDYISVKNLTLNVLSAASDGISCNGYFQMKSGTVTISGVGDDGIQADLDGATSTGETTDHEDEDSGNVYIEDGTLTLTVKAAASKGIKAAGDMVITGGNVNVTTTGNGTYDSEEKDAKGCAALKADGDMTIGSATLTLKSTGSGGKCIKADGTLTINEGTVVSATSTGSKYSYSSYTASPKAIKAGTRTEVENSSSRMYGPGGGPGGGGGWPPGGDHKQYTYSGGIVINGGSVTASASSHEAIESKGTIEINGGYVYAYSSDDAINSASDFTINGGYVMGNSSGNDGLDANGNCYIKGGNVFAVASSQPEVGIDANTEGGYKLYITGGNIVAIGGLENGSSLTGVTRKSVSYTKGSWYTLKNGSTEEFSFKVPSNSRMGSSMVICTTETPSVTKLSATPDGTSIWDGYGVIH